MKLLITIAFVLMLTLVKAQTTPVNSPTAVINRVVISVINLNNDLAAHPHMFGRQKQQLFKRKIAIILMRSPGKIKREIALIEQQHFFRYYKME